MSGLVMEYPHTNDRAGASADEGNEKERGFPDTPAAFDRLSLVNAHYGETSYVDRDEIKYEDTR